MQETIPREAPMQGRVIVELRDGRLRVCPVSGSEQETAALLREVHRLIQIGDFAEALERVA